MDKNKCLTTLKYKVYYLTLYFKVLFNNKY